MKKSFTILTTLSFVITSCNTHNASKINTSDLNLPISYIEYTLDSINLFNTITHVEPTKERRDSAQITWNSFVKQCNNKNYKAAYDIYTKNGAHFKIHLQHSSPRYIFLRDILKPLMDKYEDPDSIEIKYLDELAFEYYAQAASIQIATEDKPYMPISHPDIIFDYGRALNKKGRSEEAHNLSIELRDAVLCLTNDDVEANHIAFIYGATLYKDLGEIDKAMWVLTTLKEKMLKWKAEDATEEWAEDYYGKYINEIDDLINILR